MDASIVGTAIGSSGGVGFVYDFGSEISNIGVDPFFGGATAFTISGFAGVAVDVAPILFSDTLRPPVEVTRSDDGDALRFDILDSALIRGPGDDDRASLPVLVRTDADAFGQVAGTTTLLFEQFGGISEPERPLTGTLLGPANIAPIPLPARLPLALMGLGALALLRRRA